MDAFEALGQPTRREIVELLVEERELASTEIARHFTFTPQAVSQHLRILRDADVLRVEKLAQQRRYSVNPDALRTLERWSATLIARWQESFDRLDTLLREENPPESPRSTT